MKKKTKEEFARLKSFAWRAGMYVALAVGAYLANIGDIQEVDFDKLATIFTVTLATFIVNEVTKKLNTGK